jgi:hypothetical protein
MNSYCTVPLRGANGGTSVGRLKTFLSGPLSFAAAEKRELIFRGAVSPEKTFFGSPTFSAGEVGSAIQRFSIATWQVLQRSAMSGEGALSFSDCS